MTSPTPISGNVKPGFEAVQAAFEDNFKQRGEAGASVAVVRDGELLVDLWGGWADRDRNRLWQADTIVNVWSSTKGLVSLSAHMLIDRGLLELDAPVARWWPEFAQARKGDITVAQLLSHRAGLAAWQERVDKGAMFDWDRLCGVLAASEPLWIPDSASGYHALTFGHLVGELVRRVDGRRLEKFVREEIIEPLGIDFYIGVPTEKLSKIADLEIIPTEALSQTSSQPNTESSIEPSAASQPATEPPAALPVSELQIQALTNPLIGPSLANSLDWRRGVFPSANGHGSARALACVYGVIANSGSIPKNPRPQNLSAKNPPPADSYPPPADSQLFSPQAVERMRQVQPAGTDLVLSPLGDKMTWGMGFMVNAQHWYGKNPRALHHGGYGGSLGFADPEAGFGFAYVMNAMNVSTLVQDKRSVSLINAVYKSLSSHG